LNSNKNVALGLLGHRSDEATNGSRLLLAS
jgi:hypothetical protein